MSRGGRGGKTGIELTYVCSSRVGSDVSLLPAHTKSAPSQHGSHKPPVKRTLVVALDQQTHHLAYEVPGAGQDAQRAILSNMDMITPS